MVVVVVVGEGETVWTVSESGSACCVGTHAETDRIVAAFPQRQAMRTPDSPLTRSDRELISVVVSAKNECPY